MRLEVLVATMFQNDYGLLEKMNINSDAVIVNQCDKEEYHSLKYKNHRVIWINSKKRGLSKSRNLAIKNATADICLLADDDEIFLNDYENNVLHAFEKYKEDLLRFEVVGIEDIFKKYPIKGQKISYISSLKTSSVEIAFRRNSIVNNKIHFDELIGTGTQFKMGEENAFLFACFHKKLQMRFVPIKIAKLHLGNSSWFRGFNEDFFLSRGAAFTAMQTRYVHILIFQFAVRKYKLYKDNLGLFRAIVLMETGRKAYLSEKMKTS